MTYTSDCIPTFHYHSSCYCHLQAVPYTARKLSLRPLAINRRCEILYLLTVRHVMILFYVFIYIFNSLHVSTTSCSSSGEINCVNTTSGSCRWPCRGQVGSFISDLHTTRQPTQSDSYQSLY